MTEISIREFQENDLSRVAELCGQLGYPATVDDVKSRYQSIRKLKDHAVLVAEYRGNVVGWIHLYCYATLGSEPRTELGGLVVDSTVRGQGIGKQLMEAAENWSLLQGKKKIRFSSRMQRTEAHEFYKKLGYHVEKSSYIFAKDL